MKDMNIAAIILAAGKGKRMNSQIPKVLHMILGVPMLDYVVQEVRELSPEKLVLVLGHGSENIKETTYKNDISIVIQSGQLGTAHAVGSAKEALRDFNGDILILNGDTPLITSNTLSKLIVFHRDKNADISVLTTHLDNPDGYGRIIRKENGYIVRIVEDADANSDEISVSEINSGAYCVHSKFLWYAIDQIVPENKQKEYYLTDIVDVAIRTKKNVRGLSVSNSDEVLGVNNRIELNRVEGVLRNKINNSLMLSGVTIIDPANTYVSPKVSIGIDTTIFPNTYIFGNTKIGDRCRIGPSVWIEESQIGDEATLNFSSFLSNTIVGDNVTIGPFAHLRPDTVIKEGVKIGNFVEIKKSDIGSGSKVPHLSYVGDATIGEGVNIGAGTITCNYDGFNKNETIIEDNAFIGSDTMLVAPVKVGKGATTGAGSTITKDVPPHSLAISRSKQTVKKNWRRKPREQEGNK